MNLCHFQTTKCHQRQNLPNPTYGLSAFFFCFFFLMVMAIWALHSLVNVSQNQTTWICVFSYETKYKLLAVECNISAVSFRCWVIWSVLLCFGWSGETAEPQSCLQVNTHDITQTQCNLSMHKTEIIFFPCLSSGLSPVMQMSCAQRQMTQC